MKRRLPSLKAADVLRILRRNGFRLVRSTKHRISRDDASPPHLVRVPYHGRDLKPKTLRSIIRQAGWTEAEFLQTL